MSLTNEDLLAISNIMDKKLKAELEPIKQDIFNIKNDIVNVKNDITNIKMTLENETNRNIKIIAEGHLDISRKLNETIRISSDIKAKQEIQDIYLNTHENKLKNII